MGSNVIIGIALASLVGGGMGLSAQVPSPSTETSPSTRLIAPVRQRTVPPLRLPADLPEGAERRAPLTLEVVLTPDGGAVGQSVRQVVTGAASRMHVSSSDGAEWWFEQNAVDRRRAAGQLVQHASRTIIEHTESELRSQLGFGGWAQVLALGFDVEALASLSATPEHRQKNGIDFVRYEGADGSSLWWSPDELVADDFMLFSPQMRWRVTIESVARDVDPQRLESPASRFPEYRLLTLSDWLEQ
ncbi:MAG: hypothetical protein AB7I50_01885 [Vicinamibacterales bacterium]